MTKKYLYQYHYLDLEIEGLKERISQINSIIQKCTQTINSNHTTKAKNSSNDNLIAELIELKLLLQKKTIYYLKKRLEIENYIESIDNFEMRLILVSRIIKGNSWKKVAFDIGHYDESYPRKKFHKFFKLAEKSE